MTRQKNDTQDVNESQATEVTFAREKFTTYPIRYVDPLGYVVISCFDKLNASDLHHKRASGLAAKIKVWAMLLESPVRRVGTLQRAYPPRSGSPSRPARRPPACG
jgi:hypothetical protein